MISKAFTGRHNYWRLALGVGKTPPKVHADTFLRGRGRPEEWKAYWRMYERIYDAHFAVQAKANDLVPISAAGAI